jgi:hypothetical protein
VHEQAGEAEGGSEVLSKGEEGELEVGSASSEDLLRS